MIGASDQKATYAVGNAWMPVYKGKSAAWGRAATDWLVNEWYEDCNLSGGNSDFSTDLFVDSFSIDRDGEIFELKTSDADGYPQIQVIPAHRIDSGGLPEGQLPKGKYSAKKYYHEDGIIYLRENDRPVAYSFCDSDGKHSKFLEAEFVKHSFDKFWPEQKRGLPSFFHSLNGLKDILQSEEWERMNLLSMSSLNYTVENIAGGPDPNEPDYEGQPCGSLDLKYHSGGRIMYAVAGAGEKITQHQNFRPGNPWHEFFDLQVRMALTGISWPVSMVWKASGQGTAERNDIGKACRTVEDRQTILEKIAKWRVTYALSWAIDQGILPRNSDWYKWGFTKPAKLTIDDGRTSKERLEKFRAGVLNQSDLIAEEGNTFRETLIIRGEEIAQRELNRIEMENKYGIEIDRREYMLLTPNEMPIDAYKNDEQAETPETNTEKDETD
jgi:hypothetical protein